MRNSRKRPPIVTAVGATLPLLARRRRRVAAARSGAGASGTRDRSAICGLIAALALSLAACGSDTAGPVAPGTPFPLVLAAVSGDNQEGKTDHLLDQDFVVRVTGPGGAPVPQVMISWSVLSGNGRLSESHGRSMTDADGLAAMNVRPDLLGSLSVRASVIGRPDVPEVTFTAAATVLVIWVSGGYAFHANSTLNDFTVPVGTPVEWSIDYWDTAAAHIASIAAPAGSEHFDSGIFGIAEFVPEVESDTCCFRFIPEVVGTWEFIDKLTGMTGTLTAE